MSHYSRTLSLAMAWTNHTFLHTALKGALQDDTMPKLPFCEINGGAIGQYLINMWEPESGVDLGRMAMQPITITMTEEDLTPSAGKNHLWPLLIHKVAEVVKDRSSVVMVQDNKGNKAKSSCDMKGGPDICGIGSLIARFTGVPMMVTPRLEDIPDDKIYRDILQAGTKFPVVQIDTRDAGGWQWSDKTSARLIHNIIYPQPDDKVKIPKVKWTSPDPQKQGGNEFYLDSVVLGKDSQHHSYLIYPADYEERL
ncbi:hypothetical protein QFC24_004066 [Naganishia onofrii]|uniref:Uncharacterized protein n=1 Tax=Naganishia onofrii TaxID=1851511 RepID=A0ACC2XFN8_9TREE|nr:hypothetical protein QFC24_004066 [Naganishia onofrii]